MKHTTAVLSSSAPTDTTYGSDEYAVLADPALSVEPTNADDATTVPAPPTSSNEQLNEAEPDFQHATARLAVSAATDGNPDELPPLSTTSAPRDSDPSLDTGGGTGGGCAGGAGGAAGGRGGGGEGGGGDGSGEGGGESGGGEGGGEGGGGEGGGEGGGVRLVSEKLRKEHVLVVATPVFWYSAMRSGASEEYVNVLMWSQPEDGSVSESDGFQYAENSSDASRSNLNHV